MMITWNIDLSLYSADQLFELYDVVFSMDYSIAKLIEQEIKDRK